jgi:AbrB family looped-hinge helix DNA binding protein
VWHSVDMSHRHLTVQVGDRGRFVLPAEVRRRLDVDPGDLLVLEMDDATVQLRKAVDVAQSGRGLLRDFAPGDDLAAQLIEDRRAEAERENVGELAPH